MSSLSGVFTAIVTPFETNGDMDEPGFARLLAYQEAGGMDGIVVAGTNGESASLSVPERKRQLELAMQHKGKLRLIAGTGCSNFPETLYLTKQAQKLGYEAALVMPPYFFKNVAADGVAEYYRALLEMTDIPIFLYHIPQVTYAPITDEVIEPLLKYPNMVGIKDSSGKKKDARHFLKHYPQLKYFSGIETLLEETLKLGGAGAISGAANVLPELVSRVWQGFQQKQDTAIFQQRLTAFANQLAQYPYPAASKALLNALGLPGGSTRLPLADLSKQRTKLLIESIQHAGLSFEATIPD